MRSLKFWSQYLQTVLNLGILSFSTDKNTRLFPIAQHNFYYTVDKELYFFYSLFFLFVYVEPILLL